MQTSKITSVGAQRGAASPVIKCTPLLVGTTLYITIPDHLWALDAHTGKELWHYDWADHGGHLIGQRGVGIWKTTVFFLTPDNYLIALDSATGKERWRKNFADARKQYFSTSAPLIVNNHVIVGVGGDAMDVPGFLDSYDPETGESFSTVRAANALCRACAASVASWTRNNAPAVGNATGGWSPLVVTRRAKSKTVCSRTPQSRSSR